MSKPKKVANMSKQKKVATISPRIQQKINIIKEFGNKMGYTVRVDQFDGYVDNEKTQPIIEVELVETRDSEGNPYSWAWNLKTGQEL